jgi:hypothetical protein
VSYFGYRRDPIAEMAYPRHEGRPNKRDSGAFEFKPEAKPEKENSQPESDLRKILPKAGLVLVVLGHCRSIPILSRCAAMPKVITSGNGLDKPPGLRIASQWARRFFNSGFCDFIANRPAFPLLGGWVFAPTFRDLARGLLPNAGNMQTSLTHSFFDVNTFRKHSLQKCLKLT